MSKKQKKMLGRIAGSLILFTAGLILPVEGLWRLGIFLAAYLLIGWDILYSALCNLLRGMVLDENFLMTVASAGAFFLADYPEATAVMIFYQVGEFFQSYAVGKSRQSISGLMDIRPDYANIRKDGALVRVDPEDVAVGSEIGVTAGERIPLDGVVAEGFASVDTGALTGESVPRSLEPGSEALSGCINLSGILTIRVTKPFAESTASKILELVENAASRKAKAERFITRFARVYTPIVVVGALLLAVLPPLLFAGQTFEDWIYRALTFLVISCPCALVISVPLSFFGGIGGASRQGILVKGSNYLEALAAVETVVFDKTGTLTKGVFEVREICPQGGVFEDELLEMTALAESFSNHPISLSLKKAWGKPLVSERVARFEEIAGHGIQAEMDIGVICAGNAALMARRGVQCSSVDVLGTIIHVARDDVYQGYIVIADEVKEDAAQGVRALKDEGIRTVMLTGDTKSAGEKVAAMLHLDDVYTQLLPGNKVDVLEEILNRKSAKRTVAFVGDGINDAPVLARADVGIAMGGLGSDAAIEAADIVLMDDKPSKLLTAVRIAKKTIRIANQNIWFALVVKAVFLLLGALGIASMWGAVFADVGVSILAILNAMRAMRTANS